MKLSKTLIAAGTLAVASLVSMSALAQDAWPSRPVSLVVPFAAGGPTDVVARALAASITKSTGKTVVVENKVGAGGTARRGDEIGLDAQHVVPCHGA